MMLRDSFMKAARARAAPRRVAARSNINHQPRPRALAPSRAHMCAQHAGCTVFVNGCVWALRVDSRDPTTRATRRARAADLEKPPSKKMRSFAQVTAKKILS